MLTKERVREHYSSNLATLNIRTVKMYTEIVEAKLNVGAAAVAAIPDFFARSTPTRINLILIYFNGMRKPA